MDLTNWNAFLADPEFKNGKKDLEQHIGENLFSKIIHDALACLTNLLGILTLLHFPDVEVGDDALAWFETKKVVVETAVTEIYAVLEQNNALPVSNDKWPAAIKTVGSKLSSLQFFADEFQEIDESTAAIEKELAKMAIVNLHGLRAIYEDIQAENYKKLLKTQKYYS